MKAIILAAGYATRLRPLTDDVPKPLLPVGGRPILDWILANIRQVDEIDAIHVVTNSRFAGQFEEWGAVHGVAVHDDGTSTNDDRLGAIGDLKYVLDRAGIDDDVLVIAGDNLFDFRLADYVRFWRSHPNTSAIAVYDCGDLELAAGYGIVELDSDDRITFFVEKPADPPSTLAAIATYLYSRRQLPLIADYLAEGNAPDQAGSLVAWLYPRQPVYGYRFAGEWFDIGDRKQLLEADNRTRRLQGLPERTEYSLDL
jgi:glucose-1-phosphate thymidylyltransferase